MTGNDNESTTSENSTEAVEIVFTATARTVGELKERQSALQPMRRKTQYFRLVFMGLGGLLILASPLLLLFDFEKYEMAVTFLYGIVTFGAGFGLHNRFQDVEQELRDLEFEIELAGYDISEREIRAERMFRRNEYELLKYYHLNLRQNRWMLLVGILCIV
ncbi:MAG: hypothetical protein QF654_00800, partial [Alphaproteobacteria bacterium]|nr:hypothetical protein [Alphaproteobacteria bacterium]